MAQQGSSPFQIIFPKKNTQRSSRDGEAANIIKLAQNLSKNVSEINHAVGRLMLSDTSKFPLPPFGRFNGKGRRDFHIAMFTSQVQNSNFQDKLLMYLFEKSLSGKALEWFHSLYASKITKWEELTDAFYNAKFPGDSSNSGKRKLTISEPLPTIDLTSPSRVSKRSRKGKGVVIGSSSAQPLGPMAQPTIFLECDSTTHSIRPRIPVPPPIPEEDHLLDPNLKPPSP